MSFFKNIIYFFLSLQEKLLTQRLNKTLGIKNLSKQKNHFSNGCLLSLDSIAISEKEKMEEELKLILKTSDYLPRLVLKYIENHGTNVYYIDNSKLLHSIGENEGFIYPQRGAKALYLSLLTRQGFKLRTKEMFILGHGEINKYYFIYNLYNWYEYKHGVSGLDAVSQNLLNKY